MTATQYHTIIDSSIVINTLPRVSQEISNFLSDIYSFELTVSDIKDGYFEVAVSPMLTVKHKNNMCYFKTLDRFSIKESEIRNYELAYEIILSAIDKFNYLLSNQQTNTSIGKKYQHPDYDDCLDIIEENYFFSVPQL